MNSFFDGLGRKARDRPVNRAIRQSIPRLPARAIKDFFGDLHELGNMESKSNQARRVATGERHILEIAAISIILVGVTDAPFVDPHSDSACWQPARRIACTISYFNFVMAAGVFSGNDIMGSIAQLTFPIVNLILLFYFLANTPMIWRTKGRAMAGPYITVSIAIPVVWFVLDLIVFCHRLGVH